MIALCPRRAARLACGRLSCVLVALVASPALAQQPLPAAQPPAAQPPVAQPPVAQPPGGQPPVAQPPGGGPARAKPLLPVRLDGDLYGGLTYRLGSTGGVVDRGGGLLGASVLVGPFASSWAAGLGYERSFFGTEEDNDSERFSEIDRGLDALWFLGRAYPYQNESLSVYVALGLAPVWQRVSATGVVIDTSGSGAATQQRVSCSESGAAGLGMRVGVGAQISINEYLGFNTGLGLDHLRLSGDPVDGCAPGLGAATALSGRFGFTLTAGRVKPPPEPPPPPPSDVDRDGIIDLVDACPVLAGVPHPDPAKHGCPPPGDLDGDRITDDLDACVREPGPPSEDPQKHGCPPPPDRDGDKVIDAEDACPDLPGVATSDPATNGCPPDTDGDGIRDDKDACPAVKGLPNEDPTKHGCPLVVVTEKEIVITQQVQFETDRAVIRPVSDGLLDEVASVIKQHPEILKLEVQGHTDSTGNKIRNKLLSKSRADAVRKALIQRGVDAKVLEAKGYGQDEPIADNASDEGKAKNRRVQFKILEKK